MQGILISDWRGIDRLSEPRGSNYRECISWAINAGIDMARIELQVLAYIYIYKEEKKKRKGMSFGKRA